MNQNLEIEFKNMLTETEYKALLQAEFSDGKQQKIVQRNYYFDTKDHQLKHQESALRIRRTNAFNEITLKVPSRGYLLETNLSLSDNKCSEILEAKQLNLSELNADITIENITNDSMFYLINQFETVRYEKEIDGHLLVLDQTTFYNGQIDYELELESLDAKTGKRFFKDYLESHAVPFRQAKPKIARAAERTQPFS